MFFLYRNTEKGENKKQKKWRRNMRSKKGITLIALVVTVVILIILATIGIGAIFGKNGLISRVEQAKEKAQIEAAREKLVLKLTDLQADAIEQGKN